MSILGIPVIFFLSSGNTSMFTSSIPTFFGMMNEMAFYSLVSSICVFPLLTFIEFSIYYDHKKSIKEEKCVLSELEFLNRNIREKREKIKGLKQNKKTNQKDCEFQVVKVCDLMFLKALKNNLELYRELGGNGDRYEEDYRVF